MLNKIALYLNRKFVAAQVRDLDALKFFLNSSADAESSGEGQVFQRVKPFLEGSIAKLVDSHSADEVRHEKMILEQLVRIGGTKEPVDEKFKMVEAMAKAAGNIFDRPIEGPDDVAKAYLLLYAIERRAIERFTLMEEALRPVQPEIAEVYASIARDERRHLLFCVAVSRSVLPDDAAWTKMRDEMVELEARVFTANAQVYMWHMLDHVFTTMSGPKRFLWKVVDSLSRLAGTVQRVLPIGGAEKLPNGVPGVRTLSASIAVA